MAEIQVLILSFRQCTVAFCHRPSRTHSLLRRAASRLPSALSSRIWFPAPIGCSLRHSHVRLRLLRKNRSRLFNFVGRLQDASTEPELARPATGPRSSRELLSSTFSDSAMLPARGQS